MVKEAEWLLVADVVTEEVYSRIIMRMLTENDLEGLIESVLGGEVGLLDESFFSNLNDIGDVVVGRLMGLDCAIYSELEKKYDDDADLIAFSVDEEGKDKDDTNSDAMMIKIKKENEAKMKLDEERVAHDDNGGDNGGDDGYLAAIEEKKVSQVNVAHSILIHRHKSSPLLLSCLFLSRSSVIQVFLSRRRTLCLPSSLTNLCLKCHENPTITTRTTRTKGLELRLQKSSFQLFWK